VMSHELRTPLNVILGYAQLIQMKAETDGDEKLDRHVSNIWRSGDHLLQLIQDILDLSRIDAGELSISSEPVILGKMIDQTVEELSPLALDRGVSLVIETNPQPVQVLVDPVRLQQVLTNLITNAIKYNNPGGKVVIALTADDDSKCKLKVSDDGWGVPAEHRQDLFKPFARLGREHSAQDGTGIGLALTRRIVELLNGELRYDPAAEAGSVFTVTLQTSKQTLPRVDKNYSIEVMPSGKLLSVLYIEDNQENIIMMREVFKSVAPDTNFTVATSGAEGIDK
ncbi:MAG: sensor histidine kinase, partial [Alphaproteobacteria bacterium]